MVAQFQSEVSPVFTDHFFSHLFRLSASNEARRKVLDAQNIIMESGADKVVKLFSQYSLTTSLNYFCCLSDKVNDIYLVLPCVQ